MAPKFSSSLIWTSVTLLSFCAQSTFGAAVALRSNAAVFANATASATSSVPPSTITPAPNLPILKQVLPVNSCSYYNSTASEYVWTSITLSVGDIQLTYWPTSLSNVSYPATIYNSDLDYTFTSPSVYAIIHTVTAWNDCGQVGPTTSNLILPFNIEDVSTKVPYNDPYYTALAVEQLTLNDLNSDCPKTVNSATLNGDHPEYSPWMRCNPYIVLDLQDWREIKALANPYWVHAKGYRSAWGINDPPFAVSPLNGFPDAVTSTPPVTQAVVSEPTTQAAVTIPTAVPDLASSTSAVVTPTPAANSPPANLGQSVEAQPTPSASEVPEDTKTTEPTPVAAKPVVESPVVESPAVESPVATPEEQQSTVVVPAPAVASPIPAEEPIPALLTATITPTVSWTSTIIPQQIISLGSSGLEIVNTPGGTTATFAVPAIGATQPGVGVGQASTVVYQGVTVTAGGSAATVSNVAVIIPGSASASGTGAEKGNGTVVFTGGAGRILGRGVGVAVGLTVATILVL